MPDTKVEDQEQPKPEAKGEPSEGLKRETADAQEEANRREREQRATFTPVTEPFDFSDGQRRYQDGKLHVSGSPPLTVEVKDFSKNDNGDVRYTLARSGVIVTEKGDGTRTVYDPSGISMTLTSSLFQPERT